jgi:hypothetical protein
MADLTITVCRPVKVIEQITAPAAEVVTAGTYVRQNTSTGKLEKGNGTTTTENKPGGLTIQAAETINLTITAVTKGWLDVGDALSALAYDAPVYLSDTDGTLGTTAGTVSTVVGKVVAAWGNTTADKLLSVDM